MTKFFVARTFSDGATATKRILSLKIHFLVVPYALANNLLRRYLNFCEGILPSLVDTFLVVINIYPLSFSRWSLSLGFLDLSPEAGHKSRGG